MLSKVLHKSDVNRESRFPQICVRSNSPINEQKINKPPVTKVAVWWVNTNRTKVITHIMSVVPIDTPKNSHLTGRPNQTRVHLEWRWPSLYLEQKSPRIRQQSNYKLTFYSKNCRPRQSKSRYPKELLQSWKQLAEQTAILEVETTSSTPAFEKDKELVQFYLECFDRPAFQDDIYQEGRMEDFDKAIEDTLIALNTGVLRTRDGSILKQADGKSSIQNSLWREKLYTITDMLTAIRRRLKIAKKEKAYSTYGTGEDVAYCFYDRELAEWLNSTREEILKILSSICKEAGLRELHFRKHRYRW